jgi:uncharacterized protein YraI
MPSISSVRRGAWRRWRGVAATMLLCWGASAFVAPSVGAQEAPLGPGTPAVVQGTAEDVLLREAPGFEAGVLAPLAAGTGVEIVAGPVTAADGSSWLRVGAGGVVGFVPAGMLAPIAAAPMIEGVEAPAAEAIPAADAAPVPATADVVAAQPVPAGEAVTTSDVNLRGGPDMMAPVLAVLPPGSPLTVTGEASSGFAPVNAGGVAGWVATEFLGSPGAAPTPEQPPAELVSTAPTLPASTGGTAATTDLVNLRGGPSYEADVLSVIPPGTTVTASGSLENGFFPVQYGGQSGWVASEFLTFQGGEAASADAALAPPPPAEAPALEAPEAPSLAAPLGSGIAWPFSGGTWQVIQGYNNGTHTNRSSFANYQYSLDLARVDGETAGQTVLAPASGTVSWVDGGSGGILIDMGNGYGVAMFHITVDPSIGSGDAVTQGQPVGTVSGPGGPGYASTPHVDLTLWGLSGGGGHVSTPFSGQFAISGREFPDTGGTNQHMGAEVSA